MPYVVVVVAIAACVLGIILDAAEQIRGIAMRRCLSEDIEIIGRRPNGVIISSSRLFGRIRFVLSSDAFFSM